MSLDQIGQKLKSARDITGLSLAQIQEKTKIPYNHLASIDAGNFDDLPEPVYVSGFIRRYAECVGLDAQELVEQYRGELNAVSGQAKKGRMLFKAQKNNGNNMPTQTTYYNRQRIEKAAPNLFKLVPFYALWIILILVLIVYLVNRQGEIEQNQQDASLLTLKQSTSTITAAKVLPVTTPAIEPHTEKTADNHSELATPVANDTYRISIKAKNHVWVEVKAVSSGESLFNGFLEAGDTHDFSDKEGLRIRAGNAGNVAVTALGKTSDLGQPGKIAEKIFATNKVSQVAEGQASESVRDEVLHKSISSTTTGPNATATKKPANEAIIARKPGNESTVSKKATSTKTTSKPAHTVREDLPNDAAPLATEPNNQSPTSNKALDVPYRYSE